MMIGETLKKRRKEKGLTQKQLKELSGVHEVQIARYENNKAIPTIGILNKLCFALDIDIGEFAELEDPMAENYDINTIYKTMIGEHLSKRGITDIVFKINHFKFYDISFKYSLQPDEEEKGELTMLIDDKPVKQITISDKQLQSIEAQIKLNFMSLLNEQFTKENIDFISLYKSKNDKKDNKE